MIVYNLQMTERIFEADLARFISIYMEYPPHNMIWIEDFKTAVYSPVYSKTPDFLKFISFQ